MEIPADDLLRTYSHAALQQMARQRGFDIKKKTKDALVQSLASILYDDEAIRRSLADLAAPERRLLDQLILAGGSAPTELIRRQLEHEGVVERSGRRERDLLGFSYYHRDQGSVHARDSRKFEDLVARLGVLGLAFTAEPVSSSGTIVELTTPGRRLFIPDGVLDHLPTVKLPLETVPPPSMVRTSDPGLLLRDLYLLLSFADREPIPLIAKGLVAKRTLVRIDGMLQRSEDAASVRSEDQLGWIPLLRGLAEDLGLLVTGAGKLLLDERADAFLRQPAGERRRQLYEAYRQTTRWSELARLPDVSVKGVGASVRWAAPAAVNARQRVLAELADLTAGEWIPLDHLIERLRRRAYEFLLSRHWPGSYYYYGYHWNLYQSDNELGVKIDVPNEEAGWNLVEAGFIRAVVSGALHALGAVDLGYEDRTLTAFRITPDGARLFHGEPLPSVPSAPQVVIQPNFEILALPPTGEDILFRLDRLASRVRTEQVVAYELTRDSVYRAQRAGLDTEAIVTFLEGVSTVGIPQNVRRTLEEWGAQHERITVRRTPLLHAVDAVTLDALYDDPEIAGFLGRRVAPTVALVASANLQSLYVRLVRSGRLPALSEGPGFLPGPRLRVDSEGRLTFRQRLPSIYVLHAVRPFVDEDDATLRLSQASLRRGAKAGLSADDILATLERLQAGPLPPEVPALVRRWAKDWGRGALVEAVVLQVEQPEALADLMADPDVKPHLQPVPGAPRLALVRPESVERLRSLLDARGMTLGDRLMR